MSQSNSGNQGATPGDPNIPGMPYRYNTAPKEAYLNLQNSEQTTTLAAAQIYAAYIHTNQVTPENEREMVYKAVEVAIQMAQRVDARVKDKGEEDG